jgi:hypothetical protein
MIMRLNTVCIALLLCLPVGNPQQTMGFRDFIYQEKSDPLSGLNASIIFTFEQDAPSDRTAQLAWRMSGAEVQTYLHTGIPLGIDPVKVTLRFDDRDPVGSEWSPDRTGAALFVPVTENVNFTLAAYAANRVVIEAVGQDGTVHSFTFGLAGLQDAYRTMTGYLMTEDYVPDVKHGFVYDGGSISVRSSASAEDSIGILSWRMHEGALQIMFGPGFQIVTEAEEVDLTFQFDGGTPYPYQAVVTDDQDAATISGQTAAILTAISETATTVVITLNLSGNQYAFEFTVTGLSAALIQIRPTQ